jgi:prepilin-type N-terminal cleavage/methylation domain-containing protein
MNKQKIKAFTLMEMTITMLITAVVIGIAYTSYSIIVKSYLSFHTKNTGLSSMAELDHVLKRDFDRADIICKDSAGIALQKDSTTIKYEFYPDFILRKAARIDTFKVQSQDVNTTFKNVPVNDLQSTAEKNRVDEFGFTLTWQQEKLPYHYYKLYSAENLIERSPDAIN